VKAGQVVTHAVQASIGSPSPSSPSTVLGLVPWALKRVQAKVVTPLINIPADTAFLSVELSRHSLHNANLATVLLYFKIPNTKSASKNSNRKK